MLDDYRTLAGAKIRSDWQYRTSFVVFLLTSLLVTAADFAGIAVLFSNTERLGGWTLSEVAFIYGVAGICFGLGDLLVGSVEEVSPKVRDGSFDLLLIRPVNPLVHLTASEFSFRRFGRVSQATTVFVLSLIVNDIDWTPGRVALVPLMLASGTVIACATWVITSSVAFWTVNTQEIANSFTYGGVTAMSYPLQVFEQWLRMMLTFVVPLVFVNYLPALYILELDSTLSLPSWSHWLSPAVAVGMALVARRVWLLGLEHYQSTGS